MKKILTLFVLSIIIAVSGYSQSDSAGGVSTQEPIAQEDYLEQSDEENSPIGVDNAQLNFSTLTPLNHPLYDEKVVYKRKEYIDDVCYDCDADAEQVHKAEQVAVVHYKSRCYYNCDSFPVSLRSPSKIKNRKEVR